MSNSGFSTSPSRGVRAGAPGSASVITVTVAAGLFATSALASTDKPAAPAGTLQGGEVREGGHHGCHRGGRHRDRGSDIEVLGLRY